MPSNAHRPSHALAAAINKLANDHGAGFHEPGLWIRWLCEDVLAGLGRKLEKPWEPGQAQRLFDLTGLYGQLVAACPWRDILGPVYMEIASQWKRSGMGQFFTPATVARLMAQMTLDVESMRDSDEPIRFMEPACGSGVMLLACCEQVFTAHGPEGMACVSVTGIDADQLCALMTAAQLGANALMHAAPGSVQVWRANALIDLAAQDGAELIWGYDAARRAKPAQPREQLAPALDNAA